MYHAEGQLSLPSPKQFMLPVYGTAGATCTVYTCTTPTMLCAYWQKEMQAGQMWHEESSSALLLTEHNTSDALEGFPYTQSVVEKIAAVHQLMWFPNWLTQMWSQSSLGICPLLLQHMPWTLTHTGKGNTQQKHAIPSFQVTYTCQLYIHNFCMHTYSL